MRKNGTDKTLSEIERSNRTSPLLKALSIGLALCFAFGAGFAANSSAPAVDSASASVVDTGFCVSSSGYEGKFKGERSYKCAGNKAPAPADSVVITACKVNTDPLRMFKSVDLSWSSNRADQQKLSLVAGNGQRYPLDTSKITPAAAGKLFTYKATITKQMAEGTLGNLLASGFTMEVASAKSPSATRIVSWGAQTMNATCV